MGQFSAKVRSWVAETKERMVFVFRESAQRVTSEAQTPVAQGGNMPVKTGFLRASAVAVLNGSLPPKRERPSEDATYSFDAGEVTLVIANADIGDTITFAYTANYARYVEAKRKFVGLAAQRWPQIVDEVCREAKRRAGS